MTHTRRSSTIHFGIALTALLVMSSWSTARALELIASVPQDTPLVIERGDELIVDVTIVSLTACGQGACSFDFIAGVAASGGIEACFLSPTGSCTTTRTLHVDVSGGGTLESALALRVRSAAIARGTVTLTVNDADNAGGSGQTTFEVAAIAPICAGATVSRVFGSATPGTMAVTLPTDADLPVVFEASAQSGLSAISPAAPTPGVTSIGFTAAASAVGTRTAFLDARVATHNQFQCPVTITTLAPFDVSMGSGVVQVRPGTFVTVPLTITRKNGFTGAITPSQWIFPTPPGVSSSFLGHSTTTVLVQVSPTAAAGTFVLRGQGSTSAGGAQFVDQAIRRFEIVP